MVASYVAGQLTAGVSADVFRRDESAGAFSVARTYASADQYYCVNCLSDAWAVAGGNGFLSVKESGVWRDIVYAGKTFYAALYQAKRKIYLGGYDGGDNHRKIWLLVPDAGTGLGDTLTEEVDAGVGGYIGRIHGASYYNDYVAPYLIATDSNKTQHYNGTAWSSVTMPVGFVPYDVFVISSTEAYLACSDGITATILKWNGTAWGAFKTFAADSIFRIVGTSASNILTYVFNSGAGTAAVWRYDGANWTQVATNATAAGAYPALGISKDASVALWTEGDLSIPGYTWSKSSDSGVTWSALSAAWFGVPGTPWATNFQDCDLPTTETTAPTTTNQSPASGATGVATTAVIKLDVIDTGAGVDIDTITLSVNGTTAYQNAAAQPGFTVAVTATSTGYHFEITPGSALAVGAVTIGVGATDFNLNVLATTYAFTVSPAATGGSITSRFTPPIGRGSLAASAPDTLIGPTTVEGDLFFTTDDIEYIGVEP